MQCSPGLPPIINEHSLTEHNYIPTLMDDDNEDDNEDKTLSCPHIHIQCIRCI